MKNKSINMKILHKALSLKGKDQKKEEAEYEASMKTVKKLLKKQRIKK